MSASASAAIVSTDLRLREHRGHGTDGWWFRCAALLAALSLICGVVPTQRLVVSGGSESLTAVLGSIARGLEAGAHAASADGAAALGELTHAATGGAGAAARGTRSVLTRAAAALATASAGLGVGSLRSASASDGNASGPTFGLAAVSTVARDGTNATGTSAEFKVKIPKIAPNAWNPFDGLGEPVENSVLNGGSAQRSAS
jgi:hypothetical protein